MLYVHIVKARSLGLDLTALLAKPHFALPVIMLILKSILLRKFEPLRKLNSKVLKLLSHRNLPLLPLS